MTPKTKRRVSIGYGGELVLQFTDHLLVDGDGMDLAIYGMGPEVEPILIAVND